MNFFVFWLSCYGFPPFELPCMLMTTWKEKVLAFNLGLSKFEKKALEKFAIIENSMNLQSLSKNFRIWFPENKSFLFHKY